MDSPRRHGRITSFDVAEQAGVSQSTVSRALSGSSSITEATRNRVLEAASRLGYFVDERAARLRRGHTGTLAAVVICQPGYSVRDVNPFSYALLGGICAAASARGFEVLVSLQSEAGKLFGHYIERGQAEGLIVIGTTANHEAWDFFQTIGETSSPVAFWGSPQGDLDWVSSDNHRGACLAAQHLVEQGCKNLVCIGSYRSLQRQFAERTNSFVKRAQELGVTAETIEIEAGDDRRLQGRSAVEKLIGSKAVFDGVFAACDAIAFGAMAALQDAGLAVPDAVKLVGFDGLPAGDLSSPSLTTIEPDLDLAGRLLVESVLDNDDGQPTVCRVPVRLLQRAST